MLLLPLAVAAGGLFGALWAWVPGYLQARRGSHIVITTIMFNFLAATLMVYLLVNVLIDPGQMSPQSRTFAEHVRLPAMHEVLGWLGIAFPRTPLNMAFPWALVCGVLVWIFIWHTRWGYELRTVGGQFHRRGLRRHLAVAQHRPGHGDLRRAGGDVGPERGDGGQPSAAAQLHRPATGSWASRSP